MPKAAKLTFEEISQPELKPVDLEFLTKRIEMLTSLLARMLEVNGERTGNGTHAKDRCYDCAKAFNHYVPASQFSCPCVCHEARTYLTQLALE